MLKARLKHVTTKDKWWVDKVRAGDTSQPHANQAMTKMCAEAVEAKVVLIEWNTPESISPDTKEAIGKCCFETSGNDADIAAIPCLANFLGGTISGNLAPTPPPAGMDLQNQAGNLQPPPPSDKALLKKVWPE